MADESLNPDGKKPEQGSLPKSGMFNNLVTRSTGLPNKDPVHADPSEKDQVRQFYRLSGMSFQIVGTVIVFTLIGYWLDRQFNWNHTATITLAAVALVGSSYLFIKEAFRINK